MGGLGDYIHQRRPRGLRDYLEPGALDRLKPEELKALRAAVASQMPGVGDYLLQPHGLVGLVGPDALKNPYRLTADDPSWREQLAWKLADTLGTSRYGKQYIADKVREAADFAPLLGTALAVDDTTRAFEAGNWTDAGVNAGITMLSAFPLAGGLLGKGIKKGAKRLSSEPFIGEVSAKGLKNLASRSARIYDPPLKPPRPFEADYPRGAPSDETGKLLTDIEGRPLVADFIAGRRVVGGGEEALTAKEGAIDAITKGLLGGLPQSVPASKLPRGTVGRYSRLRGGERPDLRLEVLNSLRPEAAAKVVTHEIGHAIDDLAGNIPDDGLASEKRIVFNDLNNPDLADWRYGQAGEPPSSRKYRNYSPREQGYAARAWREEYMAEAIRAYLTNPNYLKTVAPKTAARIREFVNSNPRLRNVIQFNSLLGAGLLGAGMMNEHDAAGSGKDVRPMPHPSSTPQRS